VTAWGLKTLFVLIIPALIGIYNGFKNWKVIDDIVRIKISMFVMVALFLFGSIFLLLGDAVIGNIIFASAYGLCAYALVACYIISEIPDEEEAESTSNDLDERIKAMKEKNTK